MRCFFSAGKIFVMFLVLFGGTKGFLSAAVSSYDKTISTSTRKSSSSVSIWKKLIPAKKTKYQNVPTTVAGVRGMDEPEGTGDSNSRDWDGLKKVESYPDISDGELQNFIREGGLK